MTDEPDTRGAGAVLAAALDYLCSLGRESVRPAEAKARLRLLQERLPETAMDLLWEEQAYDESVHYDLLLHLGAEGTVSLGFCPDRALPWPLRGVQHAGEDDLVRVNNSILKVAQAVACLDFLWDQAPIVNRLVNTCLMGEALENDPVELSDAELQEALDAFRRSRRLYTAEETHCWMERRGLTPQMLENLVADEARVTRLRDTVAEGKVEGYFEAHRADFDTACVARLEFADEESARRTLEQIRSGRVDFYAEAQRRFLAGAEGTPHPTVDLFAVVQRRQVGPELGTAVFAAAPGDLVGPAGTEEGYAVVRVLSLTPARLDEPTRAAVKKILFEEWLEERRQAARIEWSWGNAARTSPAPAR